MKPLISRVAVALITFTIGVMFLSITRSCRLQVSPQPAPVKLANQLPVKPPPRPKESPSPPQETRTPEGTDLSILVQVDQNPPTFDARHIKLRKGRITTIDLDLGEDIDGQEVTLSYPDNSTYRVLQRYRTSMTISAEGPHLDLVDWRHFDSPWTPLELLGPNRFRTLRSEQMDSSRFPQTTKAEIVKEVRRRVQKDWPELIGVVKDCNGPNDGACIVTISSIYLRIQKQDDHQWTDVGMVEIVIPMGC